ncbi:hypothetical protein EMIHUDRAFT_207127 [Emiliania huxleyi CCMP1516]|uniref:Ankyrin repeat domain-containing protein n=2 Tax=Emiliania huxleyi TaxID=2903 RepID=A0A0D3JKL9_EMIH1|nr:hypothetical protein EMIHUDRAFT_207127 [Emiliania huxleyi CCMP1516]EOD24054.1 hypothetical protein EMIHUDRAFT_207127 [Emiliania huxleyi CCMP1516]|eukprot:XP_005776483.1 hypothetical protein EMIHUDRAFT_207127 [Emiliania huxleyi CCMP1516]
MSAQAEIDRLEAELARLRASLVPPSSPPSPPPSSAAGSTSGVVWWHVALPVLSVAALAAVLFVLHWLPRWLRQITDGLEEASSSVFARERAGVAGSAGDVAALLQRGASPHSALLGSGPVLSLAARGCSAEVSRLLLSAGADPDGKDSRGWTPLMDAIDAHSAAAPREQAADAAKAEGRGEGKAEGAGATDLRV